MRQEIHERQEHAANGEDELQPKETSILFAPFSIWFWLASLLVAIWFKLLPLIAVSTFLLVLTVLIRMWKEHSLKNLKPTLDIPRSRLFVGDELLVHAAIKNDKWLPLIWLEWQFARNNIIRWGDNDCYTYIIRFLWLLWYQEVKWTIKGTAQKRGVYHIGEVTLRSGDGFRFAEKEQQYELNHLLYIYPKLVPVRVPVFQPSMQWEVKGKRGGFLEDPLLISGVREYEPGDEWQRFNWRASARTGKMQTNVYQPVVSEQLMVYIDVQGFVINKERYPDNLLQQQRYVMNMKEAFEKFLSIIASTAIVYQERGISIGYGSNGLDYLGMHLQSVSPSSKLTLFLDQMAKMTQRVRPQIMDPLNELVHSGRRSGPLLIFCERITEAHCLWYEQHQHKVDIRFYYSSPNDYAVKLSKVAHPLDHLLASEAVSSL